MLVDGVACIKDVLHAFLLHQDEGVTEGNPIEQNRIRLLRDQGPLPEAPTK